LSESSSDRIPSEITESQQRYKNGEIQRNKQIHKPTQTNENHNDCFIEAHIKELEEQRCANENSIRIRKERSTIVEKINRLIKIETISEGNNNQDEEVISTEIMKMTQERKSVQKEYQQVNRETHQKDTVPVTRRTVQETKDGNNISTDAQCKETENAQKVKEKTKDGNKISTDAQCKETENAQKVKEMEPWVSRAIDNEETEEEPHVQKIDT
jgi:hypothetical protein